MRHISLLFLFLFSTQALGQEMEALTQKLSSWIDNGKYEDALKEIKEKIVLFDSLYGKESKELSVLLTLQGNTYAKQGKNAEAVKSFEKAMPIVLKLYPKKSDSYVDLALQLAAAYSNVKKYQQSEELFKECKVLMESENKTETDDYSYLCNNMGILYTDLEKFDKAEALYKESIRIRLKLKGRESQEYANACNNLAVLYSAQFKYEEAERLWLESIAAIAKISGETSSAYATALQMLGNCYKNQGKYVMAEKSLMKTLELWENIAGKKHADYASCCMALGSLFRDIGLMDNAERYLTEAVQLRAALFGEDNLDYGVACSNLAILYRRTYRYKEAQAYYLKFKEITEKVSGKKSLRYATAISNIGSYYFTINQNEEAEKCFLEGKALREELLGKKHPTYAVSCKNLADVYLETNRFKEAEELYLEALEIRKNAYGESNPEYFYSCSALSLFYYKTNQILKAKPFAEKVMAFHARNFKLLFPTYTEKERVNSMEQDIYDLFRYTNFALDYYPHDQSVSGSLLDYILLYKGAVFASTQKMKNQILSSGDSTLIHSYELWKQKRAMYAKALGYSEAERKSRMINVDSMELEIAHLERALSAKSSQFADNIQSANYSFKELQQKLGDKEILIEVFKTQRSKLNWGDTSYVMLFVTKGMAQPHLLRIDGGALEKKFISYYRSSMLLKKEDAISYQKFWKPIQQVLDSLNPKGFSKVYFCPDGVYHQLNPHTLYHKEKQKFLGELINLQLVGSSRDLIDYANESLVLAQKSEEYKAYLFGYPSYNLDGSDDAPVGEDRSANFSSLQLAIGQGVRWPKLPGTKREVEDIQHRFKDKGFKVALFEETAATEEEIKAVKNPQILHIATHGFFLSPSKDRKVSSSKELESKKLLSNSLLRAGLVFAGCENPKIGEEDGILTAEEAMNLHLDNTSLVVLSACETGLGDIVEGEGVFGLQRAFQQAGAKSVVISLWKVSDEATQLLMTEFYKQLLKKKDKRIAFELAQEKLKKSFPHPYYWGAFVMVGH